MVSVFYFRSVIGPFEVFVLLKERHEAHTSGCEPAAAEFKGAVSRFKQSSLAQHLDRRAWTDQVRGTGARPQEQRKLAR